MALVRVRPEGPWVVTHPEGHLVTLKPGAAFDDKDPLVKTFRWAFASDGDVEQATAAPGERRTRR